MSIKAKIKANIEAKILSKQFHDKAAILLDDLQTLIRTVPQKGDTSEYCQHVSLQLAFNNFEQTINGTDSADFIKD